MNEQSTNGVVSKFDSQRRKLVDVALFTKPSTVKVIHDVTGETATFIVETARQADLGDYVFLEQFDKDGQVRIVLPPKVCEAIARQSGALSSKRRSIAGRKAMAERIAAGHDPAKALREYRKQKKGKNA